MKSDITLKYLRYLDNKRQDQEKGFTLIELLVVVIILGILAAIALPSFLGQVGKARETELKNAVGTINRSQQGYHFENQTFASTISSLGINIPEQYITNLNNATFLSTTSTSSIVTPENSDASKDGTRAYGGGIVFDNTLSVYSQVMCQSSAINTVLSASVINPSTGSCGAGNNVIR